MDDLDIPQTELDDMTTLRDKAVEKVAELEAKLSDAETALKEIRDVATAAWGKI